MRERIWRAVPGRERRLRERAAERYEVRRMTRTLAYLANQTDRVLCAFSQESDALRFGEGAEVWGLGSVQQGEVLLRRRPVDRGATLSLAEMVRDLRTSSLLACARGADEPGRDAESIAPWRFRQWLCAVDGDLAAMSALRARLDVSLPDFLSLNARSGGGDERVAHLFFLRLHDEGRLDDPDPDRETLSRCARGALDALDDLSGARLPVSLIATNGRLAVAIARSVPLCWARRQGVRDLAACIEAEAAAKTGRRLDSESLRHLRYVMFASGCEVRGFQPLQTDDAPAVVVVDRALDVHVAS